MWFAAASLSICLDGSSGVDEGPRWVTTTTEEPLRIETPQVKVFQGKGQHTAEQAFQGAMNRKPQSFIDKRFWQIVLL